jgi:hypothetical protein
MFAALAIPVRSTLGEDGSAVVRHCRFAVVNPTANFHRVLAVTGLCELFGLAHGEGAPGRQAARADSAS